jgi:Mrp family chromosome partitioning ATPase
MATKLNGASTDVVDEARDTSAPPMLASRRASDGVVPCRRGAEYYDSILWRLHGRMEPESDSGYLLGLTSCERRSGVSTVAANVAIRGADQGMSPTLLIDANFHFPRQRKLLGAKKGPGLAEVLSGQVAPADAIQSTKVVGLDLLTMGSRSVLERSAIEYDRLEPLLKELRHEYRLVVFDLPAAAQLHHGLLFASHLDATLLVVRAESVSRQTVESTMSRLLTDGVNLVGTVVTGQKRYTPKWLRRWI